MATIGRLNEILANRGANAAIAYALASIELAWAAEKIRNGSWDSSQREIRVQGMYVSFSPPAVRKGKTARKREALRAGTRGIAPTNVGNPCAKGRSGGKSELRTNSERTAKSARKQAQRK